MVNIPPKPPVILPPSAIRAKQIKPLAQTSEREMPIPDKPSRQDERRYARERRGQAGQRIKGYDMRSGRDRRKNNRDQPGVEIEV